MPHLFDLVGLVDILQFHRRFALALLGRLNIRIRRALLKAGAGYFQD